MISKSFVLRLFATTLLFASASSATAQDWKKWSSPPDVMLSTASSVDGTKLIAGGTNHLWLSSDSGVTWTQATNSPVAQWQTVACSTDATKVFAVTTGNAMYYSDDSGVSWRGVGPYTSPQAMQWGAAAASADGTKLIAGVAEFQGSPAPLFLSTNSGVSWTQVDLPLSSWSAATSSADGTKLTVAAGSVYTSTNSGATWTATDLPPQYWARLASSADGEKLVAAAETSIVDIYTSTDAGRTWAHKPNLPYGFDINKRVNALASSADGTRLALATFGGDIRTMQSYKTYFSNDSGNTWIEDTNAPTQLWDSLSFSADGSQLIATYYKWIGLGDIGGVYVRNFGSTSKLNIASVNGNRRLSWVLPTRTFVLQESPDFSTSNWTTVTNIPALNPSTLENEVFLSPSSSSRYYRLISP